MKWLYFILCAAWVNICPAQDTTATKKQWRISGYIKNLESISFDGNFSNNISGNLLHQRLNIKWDPSEKITATAEFRNRLIWGEEVKSMPGFAMLLRNDNEKINLQKAWIQNGSLVLHTNTERLNIEYRARKWSVRAGRQRLNWGVTTTWNPNDIFNTYNFLDFDYEERPGVDGARFKYIFSSAASTELAFAHTGKKNGHIAAAKFNLNKWGYDWQLITGSYYNYLTAGAGWAGSIGDAGFKGECQYFFGNKDAGSHFNLSLEGDYMFKKGWYLQTGLLFNNRGLSQSLSSWDTIDLNLSPENPMPTRWNCMVTAAKEITPLFSATMSVLYAPGTHLLILLPSFRYNLAANLDADLVWQSFFAAVDKNFAAMNHRGLLRIKWSF